MDDASIDSTSEVAQRLATLDSRVEYRHHDINCGHIATYNEALATVTGNYCMILSADDLLTPGSLRRATAVMDNHPEVGLAYGRNITFQNTPPNVSNVDETSSSYRIMSYLEFLNISCRLGQTPIQAPTAIARTKLHREIGVYRPELPHSGDTEIWLRMALHSAVAELDVEQAFRRLHNTNMSLAFSPLRRLEEQKRAFDTHFREYAPDSPEIKHLERVATGAIAESAFWSGARAFERGDSNMCDAFLTFAVAIFPEIESLNSWKRFRWKRRMGSFASRYMEPLIAWVRNLTCRV